MNSAFVDAFVCEWRKSRRSLGAWLVLVGAFFTPAIVTAARLLHPSRLAALYADPKFWGSLWHDSWESMAIFFVPMAAILATSLVVQIEVRNNAWKQLHALPLSTATIYFAKLAVIVAMMLQFFVLFDVGVYLSAILPSLFVDGVAPPAAPLPLLEWLGETATYFVGCLPIVAAQYLMSLRFDQFVAPIGIGFLAWVAALASLPSKHAALMPYAYTMVDYLKDNPAAHMVAPTPLYHAIALGWFVLFTAAGYALFATRAQKG